MPRFPLRLLSLVVLAPVSALVAQGAQAPPPPRVAASSQASVEVHVNARRIDNQWYAEDAGFSGPARIAISYGQPHARGRKIEGGLMPLDTVWRFGANMATTLHADVDLMLGDLRVPRGDYTLFLRYATTGSQLIVNRGTGQWGTDYDRSKDLGRVTLASKTVGDPVESLSIYLIPDAKPGSGAGDLQGVLRIRWGVTDLSTGWRVAQ